MEKVNKRKEKTEMIDKSKSVDLNYTIEEVTQEEKTDYTESIINIDKLPGNGFGRVLGCG